MKFVAASAAAALLAALAAAPAMAQTDDTAAAANGVYGTLGGSLDHAHGTDTKSIDGRVGDRFGRYFGVEAEGSVGLDGGDTSRFAPGATTTTDLGVKQKYAGAGYAVGFLPIMPNVDLLARVGYGASKYKLSPAGAGAYDVSENGIRYGVGAQAFLDGKDGVRFDWTREHMGSFNDPGGYLANGQNANVWSLSYVRKF